MGIVGLETPAGSEVLVAALFFSIVGVILPTAVAFDESGLLKL
jgi:hypothetical protein